MMVVVAPTYGTISIYCTGALKVQYVCTMKTTTKFLGALLILRAVLVSSAADDDDDDDDEWSGYRCDDLVPPLCDADLTVTTGRVHTLRDLSTHYWRYTPRRQLNNEHKKFPIIVVNGGPGLPHNFAKPLRNLACDGREVILYDQAATGQSALPPDTSATDDYPEILELSFYAETELPKLIQHFGFPNYHVLGSSWGTEVAFQFAVTAAAKLQEQKLQSLILNAPISDNRRFVRYQWDPVTGSVGTLPTFIQERLLH